MLPMGYSTESRMLPEINNNPDTQTNAENSEEVAHFDRLADKWWDESGVFSALHRLTPVRLAYIRQQLHRYGRIPAQDDSPSPLTGLRIVDVGCGGGLLCEPLVRLGAEVVGIDLSEHAIEVARTHAKANRLNIDYACISARQLAEGDRHGFDVVIASEVIEHVTHRLDFLRYLAGLGRKTAPASHAIFTTINRNLVSVALAKYAAEYVLHLAPKGSHHAHKFVRPNELRAEAKKAGIAIDDITGIRPSLVCGFALGGPPVINYAAAGLIGIKS